MHVLRRQRWRRTTHDISYGSSRIYNSELDTKLVSHFLFNLPSWQAFLSEIILYSVTIALIKISILLFYHRIFPSRTLFKLSCILGAIIIAYNVANILVTTLQCIPLQDLWTTWGTQGKCIDNVVPYAIISYVIGLPRRYSC